MRPLAHARHLVRVGFRVRGRGTVTVTIITITVRAGGLRQDTSRKGRTSSVRTPKTLEAKQRCSCEMKSRPCIRIVRCGIGVRASGVRVSRVSGVRVKVRVSVALASVSVRAKGGRWI